MINAIKAFFQMFATLFLAGNSGAQAVLNIAKVSEEMSEAYLQEQRIETQKKLAKLKSSLKAVEKEVA